MVVVFQFLYDEKDFSIYHNLLESLTFYIKSQIDGTPQTIQFLPPRSDYVPILTQLI